MAFIVGLYLVVDVLQHKGQVRVLFPKSFPAFKTDAGRPESKSTLINQNKNWVKGVNTKELMNELTGTSPGFECDVYFDTLNNNFDIHHDRNKSIGLDLDKMLELYQQKKLAASIWLDIKNLDEANSKPALFSLMQLRTKYGLQNKLLAESNRADLLTAFSDSGFYTSYYTPMFNPYEIDDSEIRIWVDSISAVIKRSKVNALSGYYFQYTFLNHYFPNYPVLTWLANDRYSLVNRLYKWKINSTEAIFIALYP